MRKKVSDEEKYLLFIKIFYYFAAVRVEGHEGRKDVKCDWNDEGPSPEAVGEFFRSRTLTRI